MKESELFGKKKKNTPQYTRRISRIQMDEKQSLPIM